MFLTVWNISREQSERKARLIVDQRADRRELKVNRKDSKSRGEKRGTAGR